MRSAPRLSCVRQVPRRGRVQAFNYPTRWKRLRQLVRAEEPQCRLCGRPSTEVHHIKPIADGGEPYDMANLMPLCRQCHDDQHGGGARHR